MALPHHPLTGMNVFLKRQIQPVGLFQYRIQNGYTVIQIRPRRRIVMGDLFCLCNVSLPCRIAEHDLEHARRVIEIVVTSGIVDLQFRHCIHIIVQHIEEIAATASRQNESGASRHLTRYIHGSQQQLIVMGDFRCPDFRLGIFFKETATPCCGKEQQASYYIVYFHKNSLYLNDMFTLNV